MVIDQFYYLKVQSYVEVLATIESYGRMPK